jgi:hypothetical protein
LPAAISQFLKTPLCGPSCRPRRGKDKRMILKEILVFGRAGTPSALNPRRESVIYIENGEFEVRLCRLESSKEPIPSFKA